MTKDGKLCIFPFKYKNGAFAQTKTHTRCTTDGITVNYAWCATKLKSEDFTGNMDEFGECRSDGTCEGV